MNKKIKIILLIFLAIVVVFVVNLFFGIEPPLVLGPGWSVHKYVPSYNVYKGDMLVATIKPEPGYITGTAAPAPGTKPQKHPFITASAFVPEEENNLRSFLDKAKNFNDYVSLLTESGYKVSLAHP